MHKEKNSTPLERIKEYRVYFSIHSGARGGKLWAVADVGFGKGGFQIQDHTLCGRKSEKPHPLLGQPGLLLIEYRQFEVHPYTSWFLDH